MADINKVGVIGSGTMGAGIAALVANSGTDVVLMDLPSPGEDRNQLVNGAIPRLLQTDPPAFTHPDKSQHITTGNLEDQLSLLADCDWIIEAVIEDIEPKQAVYQKIDEVRKEGSIVSTNTSSIPLWHLVEGMSEHFQKDFIGTHFFNPARYMRLLEVAKGELTQEGVLDRVVQFADRTLGKGVVVANNTPGFIANRIGVYWLLCGVIDAVQQGITVEEADYVLSSKFGIPSTGVFGWIDKVGVDQVPIMADQLSRYFPPEGPFRQLYQGQTPPVMKKMFQFGYGGKGKAGFYRSTQSGDGWLEEAIDLETISYRPRQEPLYSSVEDSKNLRELLDNGDKVSNYAWSVMSKTLDYAISLIPRVADDIYSVDKAMRLGYNWKMGPFEMISAIGIEGQSGASWFADRLRREGREVPPLLEEIGQERFYRKEPKTLPQVYIVGGGYQQIPQEDVTGTLMEQILTKEPLIQNDSARLWDLEDGICGLEFTRERGQIDDNVLELMRQSIDVVKSGYKGLLIANDHDNFSYGMDIQHVFNLAREGNWGALEALIRNGQDTYKALKYAPFPVVVALHGKSLGGAAELALHADGIQAHVETYAGLVKTRIGGLPMWGGCKEMLNRWFNYKGKAIGDMADRIIFYDNLAQEEIKQQMPIVHQVFEYIYTGKVSTSAEDAKEMIILAQNDGVTMNRKYLLSEARQRCLQLAEGYQPPEEVKLLLPGRKAAEPLLAVMENIVDQQQAKGHDKVVEDHLETVLTGGDTKYDKWVGEQHVLDLEREAFMALIKTPETLERMDYKLRTGRLLNN